MAAHSVGQSQNPSHLRRVTPHQFSGGYVSFYHVPTLKLLFSLQEYDNSLNSLDFSWTGNHFATAGKDFHVRIYDEGTASFIKTPNQSPMISNLQAGTPSATTIADLL